MCMERMEMGKGDTPLHPYTTSVHSITPPSGYHPQYPHSKREGDWRCVHGEDGDVHGGEERRASTPPLHHYTHYIPSPRSHYSTIPSSGGWGIGGASPEERMEIWKEEEYSYHLHPYMPPIHDMHSIPLLHNTIPTPPLQEREKGCAWRRGEEEERST